MKNFINYYYGLIVEKYRKKEDNFVLTIKNEEYIFKPLVYNENDVYNVYLIAKKYKKACHEIILNLYDSVFSIYEGAKYILIKLKLVNEPDLSVYSIVSYSFLPNAFSKTDWSTLWKNKIDYYECQMNQFGYKYNIIKSSIGYYIGMSECAISLLNYVDSEKISVGVCHRRISSINSFMDFWDPTNLLLDNVARDIAEYLKDSYINNIITINDAIAQLKKIQMSKREAILLFSRMLYPSYYFDLYDKILMGEISEDKIVSVVKKNTSYEAFIRQVYLYLKNNYEIPNVGWLN